MAYDSEALPGLSVAECYDALRPFASQSSKRDIACIDFNVIFANGNEAQKTAAKDLLKHLHTGIYTKTFPLENEREAVSDWIERLDNGVQQDPYQIFTAAIDIKDKAEPGVAGFIVSEYYGDTQTGLINYVIRSEDYIGQLPAKELCDRHVAFMKARCHDVGDGELKGVLWEANDPAKFEEYFQKTDELIVKLRENGYLTSEEQVDAIRSYTKGGQKILHNATKNAMQSELQLPEESRNITHLQQELMEIDCLDPIRRIQHITQEFGARMIDIPYAQAPLAPPANPQEAKEGTCSDLRLFLYDADSFPEYSASDLQKYLHKFCENFTGASLEKMGEMVPELEIMNTAVTQKIGNKQPLLAGPEKYDALRQAAEDVRSTGIGELPPVTIPAGSIVTATNMERRRDVATQISQ